MRRMDTLSVFAVASLLLIPMMIVPGPAVAEEASMEEVVVTGTRKEGLSPTETLSPIDVLDGATLDDQATFDLTEGLPKVAPSINTQRYPIADGTAFIRPVTLRNLSPDQTLVLVNGTRRHRSPLVNLQLAPLGTVNQGAQAVDFAAIPAGAIKRLEILRDGASAQYGSDAIAGVINIILKDADEGFSVSAQMGEYFEGGGERTMVSLNGGFSLGGNGFVNATLERSTADTTDTGNARPDAAFVGSVVGANQVPIDGKGQRWGDPEVEVTKFFANAAYSISETTEIYGNVGISDNETVSDFFYRGPVLDPVHQFDARETLQTDTDGDYLPDPAPQSLIDDIVAAGLDPADYVTASGTSPSGYVLRNPAYTRFPGGYNPDFGADISDYAVVAGVRGELADGTSWDVTLRRAEAEADYNISETINPSLGRLSPASFSPGTLTQEESSLNVDLVKRFDVDLSSPLNVGFGLEWRDETYEIGAGGTPSIEAGPTAAFFGVGSDGFQGFPVESAGSFESESWAGYVDLEADITERFAAGVAFRYEDYDEFDSTFDWKLSGRFQLTDTVAVRATANTGFRVPTPGQVNTLNITTTSDINGNLIPNGTYPVSHPVAVTLGAKPLDPEESRAFTLGLVWLATTQTSVTLDYYQIEIEDRLALLNNNIGAAEVALLTAAGIPDANLLDGSVANFFVNGFDSEVTGIDLAVTSDYELGPGMMSVDLRHSWNEQEVSDVQAGTINQSRVFDLENQVPQHRTTLTFDYQTGGMFGGYVRINRYGDWETTGGLFSPGDASDASSYDGEILVDIEVTATFNENYRVAIGGENVFDVEPDAERDPVLRFLGVEHAITSPFGFNGGFWYLRLSADF